MWHPPPVVSASASSRLSTITMREVTTVSQATRATSPLWGSQRGATTHSWDTYKLGKGGDAISI